MRPSGIWGPTEFAQFTEDELHETMMGSAPGSNYFEWSKAELEHRDRRRAAVSHTSNVVNIGTAIHSPVQQAGAASTLSQSVLGPSERDDLTRLIHELTSHLSELGLNQDQERKANAQIATLKAQLVDEADTVIVRQAGRTLRNVTEGAIASLLATAVQPTVWHEVSQLMGALFSN